MNKNKTFTTGKKQTNYKTHLQTQTSKDKVTKRNYFYQTDNSMQNRTTGCFTDEFKTDTATKTINPKFARGRFQFSKLYTQRKN